MLQKNKSIVHVNPAVTAKLSMWKEFLLTTELDYCLPAVHREKKKPSGYEIVDLCLIAPLGHSWSPEKETFAFNLLSGFNLLSAMLIFFNLNRFVFRMWIGVWIFWKLFGKDVGYFITRAVGTSCVFLVVFICLYNTVKLCLFFFFLFFYVLYILYNALWLLK